MKGSTSYCGHLQAVYLVEYDKYAEFSNNCFVKGSNAVAVLHSILDKLRLKAELDVIYKIGLSVM